MRTKSNFYVALEDKGYLNVAPEEVSEAEPVSRLPFLVGDTDLFKPLRHGAFLLYRLGFFAGFLSWNLNIKKHRWKDKSVDDKKLQITRCWVCCTCVFIRQRKLYKCNKFNVIKQKTSMLQMITAYNENKKTSILERITANNERTHFIIMLLYCSLCSTDKYPRKKKWNYLVVWNKADILEIISHKMGFTPYKSVF